MDSKKIFDKFRKIMGVKANARNDRKTAFTLAEVLISLTVLGIIAAITLPPVFRKYQESVDRTKIKKGMKVYEYVVASIVNENDIRSESQFRTFAEGEDGSCDNLVTYIKVTEREGCEFKTADNTYYDASNSTKPIIATSKKALKNAQENGTDGRYSQRFKMSFDQLIGTPRVNDLGYEKSLPPEQRDEEAIEELEQLLAFVNNETKSKEKSPFASCKTFPCEVNGLNWNDKMLINQAEANEAKIIDDEMCSWDPKKQECTLTGGSEVKTIGEDLFVSEELTLTEDEAKSKENCAESRDSYCTTYGDYWNLARIKCDKAGGRLPTTAELRVMKNKGRLDSLGNYWGIEAFSDYTDVAYAFAASSVNYNHVNGSYNKAVCVSP